ncbi:hypothetical protein [Bacillus cereus]|uniref:Uncharacterized protein n=1 Tax=Bacillus cereus VD048 TaxID=1053226 RepID=J8HL95_BACCE|nr:hypothetical protein [Bacillus cereus]EJR26680.1 hypothetical protein IIG_05237 [Bacillus cereus VD048]
MPNENNSISLSPKDINIDESGRVIIEDPMLAASLTRIREINPNGTMSCNVECPTANVGACKSLTDRGDKLEDIRVNSTYRDRIMNGDMGGLRDIGSIRDHLSEGGGGNGPPIGR